MTSKKVKKNIKNKTNLYLLALGALIIFSIPSIISIAQARDNGTSDVEMAQSNGGSEETKVIKINNPEVDTTSETTVDPSTIITPPLTTTTPETSKIEEPKKEEGIVSTGANLTNERDVEGTLRIFMVVTNDNGGAKSFSDFTVTVSGNNPTPATFSGNEITYVSIGAGYYGISLANYAGYTFSTVANCSDTMTAGGTRYCTILLDDIANYDSNTNYPPIISLLGENPFVILVGDTFTDPGVTTSDPDQGDTVTVSSSTEPAGPIDTSRTGIWFITYVATDSHGGTATKTRTLSVNPLENVCPNHTKGLMHDVTLIPGPHGVVKIAYVDGTYSEATTSDEIEDGGNITYAFVPDPGYKVNQVFVNGQTITAFNPVSFSTLTCVSQDYTIRVTFERIPNRPPTIQLIGSNSIVLNVGDVFTDPGVTTSDPDFDDFVTVSTSTNPTGGVNTESAGSWVITYVATDTHNASSSVTRAVTVNVRTVDNPGGGNPPTPPTDTVISSGGGSSNGGSSGGYGNFSQLAPATSSCPLITTYMRLGANNDGGDVTRLQSFFRNSELLNVDVTGIFDIKTDQATREFQTKYSSDILGPWSASIPSGYVYITTSKKVNQLACSRPIVLSSDELAIIEKYKQQKLAALQGNAGTETPETNGNVTPAPSGVGNQASSTEELIGSNQSPENSNVAAVGSSSILSKFWGFLKNLFNKIF
ncbi:MAG: hypothetical protein RL536_634 [Candidatus Parcubacteria bacterium]|jgi:hypothetical protein